MKEKNSLGKEKESKREKTREGEREKKEERDERRRSRRVIEQTSRYFRTSLDRTDGRSGKEEKKEKEDEEEAAMNFALPEDEMTKRTWWRAREKRDTQW